MHSPRARRLARFTCAATLGALVVTAYPDPAAAAEPIIDAEIVVTAARTDRPLQVVTDPTLARQPAPTNDGADYLKSIAGFNVIRKGGTSGDPLFRGMAGSRVNILSNEGILLGGCGSRMDPPTAYIYPQSHDRMIVLKGPQSVLWGAGGSAATVIFERDPFDAATDDQRLGANMLLGAWGRRDLSGGITVGNDSGYVRLLGSDARSDDYDDGNGDAVHSAYRRWNVNATVGLTPGEHTLIELSGTRSDGRAAYADRMMDGVAFDREAMTVRWVQRALSPRIREIETQIALSQIDHVMDNFSLRDFSPTMMMANPAVSNPDRRTLAARFSATLEPTPATTLVVGLDGHDDRQRLRRSMNVAMMPIDALPRMTDARYEQRGAFAELSIESAPGHAWHAGARLDRWRVENARVEPRETTREWLPSGFVRYERTLAPTAAGSTRVLYAGLGHARRTADYWERFGNGTLADDGASAFHTDPERLTQIDVGITSRRDREELSVALFANHIDDYILLDATRVPGRLTTRNVTARSYGGEIEYARRFAELWQLESSLAYTRGENRSDNAPLAQMPPLEGRLGLTRRGERHALGVLLRWVAKQGRVDPGRGNIVGQDIGPTSGFTVLSMNGSYRFSERISVAAGIDNLLDEPYAEHLSRSGAAVGGFVQTERVNEPGRMAWLQLDVTL